MDKELEKKILEARKKLSDIQRKKQDAEKEEEGLTAKLKDPEAPEVVDVEPATVEPENKKARKPRAKKADTSTWEAGSAKAGSKKTTKNYDKLVSSWIDQETQERKDGQMATEHSPESEQASQPGKLEEPKNTSEAVTSEEKVEVIANKQMTGELLTKEELDFYFENRDPIYKSIDEKWNEKFGIKEPLTPNQKKELEREKIKKNITDTLEKAKELGATALNKTKTAFEMFGKGGNAVTGMSKEWEPEGIYPKTPEEVETEFELTRRLYFEYTTGSAKFKKESEMFKQHAEEKGKAYQEAKKAKYQELVNEGRVAEANEFIAKEVELKRDHEIKHGSLWNKLKGGASQKIEAWDKWGVDKEGATWDEKLSNWNKRIIKRAVNISFIGITSSLAVAGLASKGIGTATALSGGVTSRLVAKLGWGVTLGTATEYLMTKIPKGADAEASKRILKKLMIGGAVVGGGFIALSGVSLIGLGVGASAAGGHLVSKWVDKKGWTEKGIQEKKAEAKSKFNVSNLDELEKYEQEYLNTLKQAENSRIYRKTAGTLLAITTSGLSLELMGVTQDKGLPSKEFVGEKFDSAKRGLKRLGSMISAWWNKDDSEGVMVKESPVNEAPKASGAQDGEQKFKVTPKKPELITETEPKENNPAPEEKEEPKNENKKTGRRESDDNDDKKERYRNVTKNYGGGSGSGGGYDPWGNNGEKKVGYTEVNAVRNIPDRNENGQHLGYKDYTPKGDIRDNNEIREERNERSYDRGLARLSTEEMADKVYSENLTKILNTPESQKVWETLHSQTSGTDAIPFLEIDRNDLSSVQIKNLQDYILKVMDETKLKPGEGESIQNFLSRAFDKASNRPRMLEDLIIK